jgi:hypothetical protein
LPWSNTLWPLIKEAWPVIRDVALTGTGIFVIIREVYSPHPSDVLLAVAMGLTAPAAYEHVRALLSGPGASSPPPPQPSAPPSAPSSPEGGTGE